MPDPTVLIDRYEVHGLLGAGGSARVHVGHDRMLDRRVAIKLLDADVAASADPAGHARFVREAQSAAGFSHTHAVATFDAGQDDHQLFIVMEYVDGVSLAQRIADDAPFAESEIVRIGTQLLSALGAAHEAGIVHRDVKPANVLIDQSGDVKLTDFGIAQRFDEITQALTVEGMVMGTRGYLAPERARGLDGGPQVDLFAVGAVLYEMATGRRAPSATPDSVVGADPRTTRPGLAPTIATAIMTALAGRPEHRFSTAADMTLALRGHLPPTQLAEPPPAAEPPATVPPGPSARPTEIMGATGSRTTPETALMPAATPPPAQRSGASLLIAALVLIVVAGGLIALARNDRAPDAAPAGSTAVSEVSSAPSAPATTVAPNTAPPSTPPPTTAAPTTPPTTIAAELIPGFPATDDIDQFIQQLRSGRNPAGKQARKLSDELRDLLKSDGDKIAEKADDIAVKIEEWVDEGELDPTVAARALEFVDELARG